MSEPKCPIANMVCPRNNDPSQGKYCPKWWVWTEENLETRETRIQAMCNEQAEGLYLQQLISSVGKTTEATESFRNTAERSIRELTYAARQAKGLTHED